MSSKTPGMPEDSQYGMSSPLAREVARVFGFRAHSKEVGGPVTRWEADGGKDVTKKMAHLMSIIEAGEIAISKMSTTALEAAKREARDGIGHDLPHSTARGNSLEIWSWKTPTGRKWNAAYIDSKRRPVEIATGDSIAEALDKLPNLSGESSR